MHKAWTEINKDKGRNHLLHLYMMASLFSLTPRGCRGNYGGGGGYTAGSACDNLRRPHAPLLMYLDCYLTDEK